MGKIIKFENIGKKEEHLPNSNEDIDTLSKRLIQEIKDSFCDGVDTKVIQITVERMEKQIVRG